MSSELLSMHRVLTVHCHYYNAMAMLISSVVCSQPELTWCRESSTLKSLPGFMAIEPYQYSHNDYEKYCNGNA